MIRKEKLKEIIVSNREFILSIDNIIEREGMLLPEKLNKVVVLYGPRRSGKSFILFDFFKKNSDYSLYIDFEDERLSDFELEDFDLLKEAFIELNLHLLNKKKLFFLDEIQNVTGWEKFCRRAVEKENISVFVAGSSSKVMPKEIHTSLRGRTWSIEVVPFSFKEFLKTKEKVVDDGFIFGSKKVYTKKYFSEYLKWGGFPEVVMARNEFEKKKIIKEYLASMFFRDLVERFRINNIYLLEVLMDKIFSSFSQKFSLTSFYKQYKEKFPFSKDTLFNYYKFLLQSMLVFEVRKFAESSYKRLRNPSKIYLLDVALAKKVTSEDYGRLLENIVFLELRKGADEIFYFEEEQECDFIVKKDEKFFPYQVCFELTERNQKREISGLVSCCKWLKIKEGVILTNDQEEIKEVEGIKINIAPAWKWLLKSK